MNPKGLTSTYHTAKPSVENKSGLLNNRACVLSHYLINAESPNLQLISGSWPSASWLMQISVCYFYMGNKALLLGDSTHKLYCSEVHFLNQQQWQFGPPVAGRFIPDPFNCSSQIFANIWCPNERRYPSISSNIDSKRKEDQEPGADPQHTGGQNCHCCWFKKWTSEQ